MRISVTTILVGMLAVACGSSDSGTSTPVATAPTTPTPSPATTAPTFTDVYTRVLTPRCALCHMTPGGIGISEGKLDMTGQANAYANLVNVPAAGIGCAGRGMRVVPGQPGASILYLKVSLNDSAPCGEKMPFGGPPLTSDEADLILGWINDGAPNN